MLRNRQFFPFPGRKVDAELHSAEKDAHIYSVAEAGWQGAIMRIAILVAAGLLVSTATASADQIRLDRFFGSAERAVTKAMRQLSRADEVGVAVAAGKGAAASLQVTLRRAPVRLGARSLQADRRRGVDPFVVRVKSHVSRLERSGFWSR